MNKLQQIAKELPVVQLDHHIITLTTSKNEKVNGRFYRKFAKTTDDIITTENYINFIKSIASFGDKYAQTYTSAGYLITTISSVSPDKTLKNVYTFTFKLKK